MNSEGIEDLEPAFDDVKAANAQAAIFMADNVMFGNRKEVAELALRHRLPTMHSFPPEVRDGGLMFYGPSNEENYRRALHWPTGSSKARVQANSRSSSPPNTS